MTDDYITIVNNDITLVILFLDENHERDKLLCNIYFKS